MVCLFDNPCVSNLQLVALFCDNKSALEIGHYPVMRDRNKHIAIDHHLTGEKVLEGLLHLAYILTAQQLVDLFTKIRPSSDAIPLLDKHGLVNTLPSLRGNVKHIHPHSTSTPSFSFSCIYSYIVYSF